MVKALQFTFKSVTQFPGSFPHSIELFLIFVWVFFCVLTNDQLFLMGVAVLGRGVDIMD